MLNLLEYIDDLVWMLYPILCAACNKPLYKGENCICTKCLFNLPRTGFHIQPGNNVERHFWGKVKITRATAGFFFGKGQRVQKLVHQLKYKGRKDVGEFVGIMLGKELCESDFSNIDLIVPVPLHKSRLKHRGYNQSDCFAEGLSKGMNKPASLHALIRKEATTTQTKKHRYERYLNVDNIFEVSDETEIEEKHVLLVDDVITTGSTLIACAEALLTIKGVQVSIAAIACA
jgi:ComF family protein